jgi:acetate kinase
MELDPAANAAHVGGREGRIDRGGSRLELWVIPTDEELLIARDAYRVVAGVESRF